MHTDKATRLQLFDLRLVQTRVFHLTWMAFFVCFFRVVRLRSPDAGDSR